VYLEPPICHKFNIKCTFIILGFSPAKTPPLFISTSLPMSYICTSAAMPSIFPHNAKEANHHHHEAPKIFEYASSTSLATSNSVTMTIWWVTFGSLSRCSPIHSSGGVASPMSRSCGVTMIGGSRAVYVYLDAGTLTKAVIFPWSLSSPSSPSSSLLSGCSPPVICTADCGSGFPRRCARALECLAHMPRM